MTRCRPPRPLRTPFVPRTPTTPVAAPMVFPLLVLVGGTLATWVGVLLCASETTRAAATLGMVITLPPAVLTMLAVLKVNRLRPDAGPSVILAGTFIRMLVAVGCVAVLQEKAAEYGTTATALGEWTTGFYLLTLVLETGLLWRVLTRPPAETTKDEPPADEPRR